MSDTNDLLSVVSLIEKHPWIVLVSGGFSFLVLIYSIKCLFKLLGKVFDGFINSGLESSKNIVQAFREEAVKDRQQLVEIFERHEKQCDERRDTLVKAITSIVQSKQDAPAEG